MMKVTFYGQLASLFGRELDLRVEGPCTVARAREMLLDRFPEHGAALCDRHVRACVGGRVLLDDDRVGTSDQLEFLAPVSGG